jgi:hypothetical protein
MRPVWPKNAMGFDHTIVSMSCSEMPAFFISSAVFGTLSGSLTPQSAALLMMMRSVPYFSKRATILTSFILVSG